MRRRCRTTALLALAGVALVAAARLAAPLAPPLYDGITTPVEPYHYISPPADLAANNKPALGGTSTLQPADGETPNATVQTDDKQALAFFPKGAFKATAPVTVTITPDPNSPPPRSGTKQVGNAYRIEAYEGAAPSSPAPGVSPASAGAKLLKPAQVLLRVPPVNLTGIRLYYDGDWHDVPWGAQSDYINITMDHLGELAGFDDGNRGTTGPGPQPFNWIVAIEAALVVVAVLVVVAAVIVQRRRGPEEEGTPGPKSTTGPKRRKKT